MAIPLDHITHKRFDELKKNYQTLAPTNKTISGWVSVIELMKLVSDNNANGVRIYFGRYKDDEAPYPGQNTVMLVATRGKADPTTFDSDDVLTNEATILLGGSFEGLASDMIPLCPPNCRIAPAPEQ
jgi:hypothetical protein